MWLDKEKSNDIMNHLPVHLNLHPLRHPGGPVLIWLLVLLSSPSTAQQFSKKVHKVPEVHVTSHRNQYYVEDQKITLVDSAELRQYQAMELGEMIEATTPLHIRSYGAKGAISVPSFRGSTAQHTSVTWNGFPIRSMTLGQCDLSLTPASFTDKVQIRHSAPGSLYGSGTFGGAIALSNEADWDRKQSLGLTSELGSWESRRYGVQANLGNEKLHYRVKGFYQKARNDFEYRDYNQFGKPLKERQNNSVRNLGVMQNFYYHPTTRNRFEAGIWYQDRLKHLPDIMGVSGQSHASQKDSSLRAYVGWKRIFDHASVQVRTGFFHHYQLYREKENPGDQHYMIYSPLETQKWLNDINYRHHFNNRMSFDVGLQYTRIQADVDDYSGLQKEYRAALIGAFKYQTRHITTNVSVRQQFNNYTNPLPQVSLGANYRPRGSQLFVRTHFSTKYRMPTLNDKYWQPGGNKDLKPEHGWTGEVGLGYVLKHDYLTDAQSRVELTGYQSNIYDMIEWLPKQGASYWHPVNNARVRTTGLEAGFQHRLQWNQLRVKLHALYNYTRALNLNNNQGETHHQLRYTPLHSLKNSIRASFRKYSATASIRYTGDRYSTADNDPSGTLEDYTLVDMHLGRQWKMEHLQGDLQVSIKNLLDKQYQVIANYPMPGRAFYVNLNIQINQLFNP